MGRTKRLLRGYRRYDTDLYEQIQYFLRSGYEITRRRNYWVASYNHGLFPSSRRHAQIRPLLAVLQKDVESRMERVQTQKVCAEARPSDLADKIEKEVRDRGVTITPVAGIIFSRMRRLQHTQKVDPVVAEVIKKNMPEDEKEAIESYHNSAMEKDDDAYMRGATVLLGDVPDSDDLMWDTFFEMAWDSIPYNGKELCLLQPKQPTATAMAEIPVANRSAGLLPALPGFGKLICNKKEGQVSAVHYNLRDLDRARLGELPLHDIPYKPCPKQEVIKKGKKVRFIMVEPEPTYLVLDTVFGPLFKEKRTAFGSAVGFSTVGGGFQHILLTWYYVWTKYNEGDYQDFLSWLEHQEVSESDVVGWEGCTGRHGAWAYDWKLLLSVNLDHLTKEQRILVASKLASKSCPAIMLNGSSCYYAPYKVPSGSVATVTMNTEQHGYMINRAATWIEEHDYVLKEKEACECPVCKILPEKKDVIKGYGRVVSREEVAYVRAHYRLGDDRIMICGYTEFFDFLMTTIYGMEIKTSTKPFFSTNEREPEGAEFLRRHFRRSGDLLVTTFRAPTRVLAKLYHGDHRRTPEHHAAAVYSALVECGDNRYLYDVLRPWLEDIKKAADPVKLDAQIKEYVRRNRILEDLPGIYTPEFETLRNADHYLTEVIRTGVSNRILAERFNMTRDAYFSAI